uniref:ectopic P granules protein 5 homolog isoform X1 n=1 Tax=Ciona intestinalis TaxID=7719 RepID=UPI000EF53B2B|nr:ectopic P granules protein 5 homolog isoform X1 [Ciona intestinalis]XP_026694447.1 ectopic P granules protein 5 homolog isoform X2 [Ciona intestinalis]|eukprot:XP_026694446.1 ectopic P granules protein 5 homolog isoform X1 [Ciona intestinalis]
MEYRAALEQSREKSTSGASWTMIDDEGEEIDSTISSLLLPLESDLILVFRQVPMASMLAHALKLVVKPDGKYEHPTSITSETVLTSIAVCDLICDILGEGLATLGRPKYKQLVRRIAQSIRNTVLIVAEQWQLYKDNHNNEQTYSMERLQLEFDEFTKRCVSRLLSVARLGVYQFIADLSYHTMSPRAAETIYLLMNVPSGVRSEVDCLVATDYTKQEWLEFINDPDTKLAFEEQLSTMPANEIVYLLTAFANLAQARPTTEKHLVETIAVDIFKVSFVYRMTRDICSKTGRELLCSVAYRHPYVISMLVQYVFHNMDQFMSTVVYSLSDLPYSSWQPLSCDLELLRVWLLGNPITSTEFKLAKMVLQGLNFGYRDDGHLFLPLEVHYKISMLILETNVKLEQDRIQSGIVVKSIDHVSKVASAVRLTPQSIDHKVTAWSWEVLLKLKLHRRVWTDPKNKLCDTPDTPTPDMNNDPTLLPLLQATKDHHTMASYIAVAMTRLGDSKDSFLHEGLECLHHLASSGHMRAVLSCLYFVVPMFQRSNINLAENQKFTEILRTVVHQHNSVISGLTNLILQDTPHHPYAVLLCSVVQNQVVEAPQEEDKVKIISYWLKMILTIIGWFKDDDLCLLVDYLFKSANQIGDRSLLEFRTQFYESYIHLMLHSNHRNHGNHKSVVSSLLSMVTGGNQQWPLSFLPYVIKDDIIYFAYVCIEAETRYEDDCKLWATILSNLRSDRKMSVETALKKSVNKLKLSHNPTILSLTLYRWGELALHTPYSHPVLELIWLNFFLRFVSFPLDGGSSLGYRFFESVPSLPLYNKLRSRLQSTTEFHHGEVSSGRGGENGTGGEDGKARHNRLIKIFHTFKLWLEEPKVHEQDLYLPSLPNQYNADLLSKLRTRDLKLNLDDCQVKRFVIL